jgi:positive regulator of sigma E activity
MSDKKTIETKPNVLVDTLPLSGLILGSSVATYKNKTMIHFIGLSILGFGIGYLAKNKLTRGNFYGWH